MHWRIQCVTKLKKNKKNLVGIYKFKKYGFVKVPILIFVLNPHFRFKKKNKIKVIKLSKL